MKVLAGRAALSVARAARALAKVKTVAPAATGITARWVHLVDEARPLTEPELAQLRQMLDYGPSDVPDAAAVIAPAQTKLWIAPRLGTTSPWSSKATDIARVCGLSAVLRIERAVEYTVTGFDPNGSALPAKQLGAALADRMTESVITDE
ncbi:MAG: phosphoribosylformylglycinamidine synthase, partial [Myxococcales bacterium]|nr:phosphoribosylformylglycinamidine synthase [Myxococcales bacterium]